MNTVSIIIAVLLAAAFVLSLIYIVRHRGNNCGGCTGNCENCAFHKK